MDRGKGKIDHNTETITVTVTRKHSLRVPFIQVLVGGNTISLQQQAVEQVRLTREKMSKELDGTQKGQTLVIVALAMVVLVGFLALAIDGGNAYAERRHMQNAADAGGPGRDPRTGSGRERRGSD